MSWVVRVVVGLSRWVTRADYAKSPERLPRDSTGLSYEIPVRDRRRCGRAPRSPVASAGAGRMELQGGDRRAGGGGDLEQGPAGVPGFFFGNRVTPRRGRANAGMSPPAIGQTTPSKPTKPERPDTMKTNLNIVRKLILTLHLHTGRSLLGKLLNCLFDHIWSNRL